MPISGNLAITDDYQTVPARHTIAVLSAAKQFVVQQQPTPQCGPNDIMIRLEGCGVCASNLPVWEGRPWFEYPLPAGAPGHEGWGRVIAVGDQVETFSVDQRVACLGDRAFAEIMCVPAEDAVRLPEELDDIPFPGEAIGCAMNIFKRADVRPDQTVAIIGAGFLGLLLVQLSIAAGARVIAISRRAEVRQLAEQFGAEISFDTEDWWGNAQKVIEYTQGRGCDRVMEVTGMQFALDMATEMIGEYGKLVIGGYHQDGLRQVNMQKWNWRAIDVINAHERDRHRYIQGIREGISATISGRISPQTLLTHRFSLEQLNDAYQMMCDRPDGFIKGWIEL